jgi:nicotinate phosphoribosyltransferase
MAYKLVEFDGRPTLKLSEGKATLPGQKQVWRLNDGEAFSFDVVGLAEEAPPERGEPLLGVVMERGERLVSESLAEARERCADQRLRLAPRHRALSAAPYEVTLSERLVALRDRVADEQRQRHGLP